MNLGNEKEESKAFELVVQVRDKNGHPTGKTKTIKTNSAYSMWKFWQRHKPKISKKSKKIETIPSKDEADKILKTLYRDNDE